MRNSTDKEFTDLGEIEKISPTKQLHHGNVIKSNIIRLKGSKTIQVQAGTDDEPQIVIHRNGENIESVEFGCKCGRSSRLIFEYEDE
jgi:hypothetical protein